MAMSIARRRQAGLLLLGGVVLLLLASPTFFLTSGYRLDVARLALYIAILAGTWSLLAGVAGQFSFAHVAIAGLGAYASVIWVRDVTGVVGSTYGGIIFGTLFAGLIGTLLGLLLLRLRAAYLALFTIAFAEMVRLAVVAEVDLTGGRLSLAVTPLPGDELAHFYLMVGLLALILGMVYWLMRSRIGLFLVAMREDEQAAAALGVNVVRSKVLVFSITSLMLGFAASTYAHTLTRIAPERLELLVMGQVIAVAVIGGLESPLAAVVGALVTFGLLESLRQLSLSPFAMDVVTALVALVTIVLGVVVIRAFRVPHEPVPRALARQSWILGVGILLVTVFLFMVGTAEGNASLATWTLGTIGAGLISVFAMRAYSTGMPAWLEKVFPSVIVGLLALSLLVRLIPAESLSVDLGVWRFGAFGLILMLTLRFARNGLVYPLLQYFSGASELRKETVAFRDEGDPDDDVEGVTASGEAPS